MKNRVGQGLEDTIALSDAFSRFPLAMEFFFQKAHHCCNSRGCRAGISSQDKGEDLAGKSSRTTSRRGEYGFDS